MSYYDPDVFYSDNSRLLTNSELSGNKTELMKKIFALLDPSVNRVETDDYPDIDPQDFFIDSARYFLIKKMSVRHRSWFLICFLDYIALSDEDCSLLRKIADNEAVRSFVFRRKEYTVPMTFYKSFLFHNCSVKDNIDSVLNDYDNNVIRNVPLYPRRESVKDGQSKIMVDAVLAVDALDSDTKQSVLIIGSSHEPGITPKSAYYPIFHMLKDSVVEMYDPFEEDNEEIINTNVVKRYRKPYLYDNKDLSRYDLVIDDAWTKNGTSFAKFLEKEGYGAVDECFPNHFSLKVFDIDYPGRYYSQVGKTSSRERRFVSRAILPLYNKIVDEKLGRSSNFTIELIFNLKKSFYSDEFYKTILAVGKSPYYKDICDHKVVSVVWEKSDPPDDLVGLFIDNALTKDYKRIELRREHLFKKNVVVSSDIHVTNIVVDNAYAIFKEMKGYYVQAFPLASYQWYPIRPGLKMSKYEMFFDGDNISEIDCVMKDGRDKFKSYILRLKNRKNLSVLKLYHLRAFQYIVCDNYYLSPSLGIGGTVVNYVDTMVNMRRDVSENYVRSRHKLRTNLYNHTKQFVSIENQPQLAKELDEQTKLFEANLKTKSLYAALAESRFNDILQSYEKKIT